MDTLALAMQFPSSGPAKDLHLQDSRPVGAQLGYLAGRSNGIFTYFLGAGADVGYFQSRSWDVSTSGVYVWPSFAARVGVSI